MYIPSPAKQSSTLTPQNLSRVPKAPSKTQTYLRQEQNFEKVPLGLAVTRKSGKEMVSEFERAWNGSGGR